MLLKFNVFSLSDPNIRKRNVFIFPREMYTTLLHRLFLGHFFFQAQTHLSVERQSMSGGLQRSSSQDSNWGPLSVWHVLLTIRPIMFDLEVKITVTESVTDYKKHTQDTHTHTHSWLISDRTKTFSCRCTVTFPWPPTQPLKIKVQTVSDTTIKALFTNTSTFRVLQMTEPSGHSVLHKRSGTSGWSGCLFFCSGCGHPLRLRCWFMPFIFDYYWKCLQWIAFKTTFCTFVILSWAIQVLSLDKKNKNKKPLQYLKK